MKRNLIITCIFCLLSPMALAAHDSKQLNQKIASIKTRINLDKSRLSVNQRGLKKIELRSAKVAKALVKTDQQIQQQQALLAKLKQQQQIDQQKLSQQQAILSDQISASYQLKQPSYLKLLLNPQAKSLDRMLIYYQYIFQARQQMIHSIRLTLNQLQQNVAMTTLNYQKLLSLKKIQLLQQQKLKRIGNQRQQLISQLSLHLSKNTKLLESTIVTLEKQARLEKMGSGFKKLRGHMILPSRGRILTYFGTQIRQSELKWNGILIKVRQDQPVRAIADGKVVFAKWLEGYGLLIILDHGDGYMSLYGRNHYLYKNVGDIVAKGDIIAAAGKSGGYSKSALYFALRHNAKPLNPLKWCKRRA